MADIYKIRWETHNGDVIYLQSAADIIEFNSNKAGSLSSKTVQDAIIEVENHVIENRTEFKELLEQTTVNITNQLTQISTSTDGKAELLELTTTIPVEKFTNSEAPFTQTLSVVGVLESDIPIIGLNPTGDVGTIVKQIDSWCSVSRIQTLDDKLVITCLESKPLVDLPIQIKIIRQATSKSLADTVTTAQEFTGSMSLSNMTVQPVISGDTVTNWDVSSKFLFTLYAGKIPAADESVKVVQVRDVTFRGTFIIQDIAGQHAAITYSYVSQEVPVERTGTQVIVLLSANRCSTSSAGASANINTGITNYIMNNDIDMSSNGGIKVRVQDGWVISFSYESNGTYKTASISGSEVSVTFKGL